MRPAEPARSKGGPSAATIRQRLTARERLKRQVDFSAVRKFGKKVECGPFALQIRKIPEITGQVPLRRLGVIASRKVGSAVKRNRAKRLMREIFRINQEILPPRADVVMIARKCVFDFSLNELEVRYLQACQRLVPFDISGR